MAWSADNWRAVYPDIESNYTDDQLTVFYTTATALFDESLADEDFADLCYNLLVCHLATLYTRGTDTVGTVSSATQGSVSVGYSVPSSSDSLEGWYAQTQCGWTYWLLTARFRRGGFYHVGHKR